MLDDADLPNEVRRMALRCVVLIPTYNECNNVQILIEEIFSILPEIHIMVIDDGSPDGTSERVIELSRRHSNLTLYARAKKEGLGKAYLDVFRKVLSETDFESVIMMDADGSHSARYLPLLLSKLAVADVVVGSRYVSGGGIEAWETWRRVLSRGGNLYGRLMTGLPVKDLTAGFMCLRRETLSKVVRSIVKTSGYSFLIELKFNLVREVKAKVVEVPIVFRPRREGESKISRQIIMEGVRIPLWLLWKRFSTTERRGK